MKVGDNEVVALEEARGRQHEIGQVGGVGREQVNRDREQIVARERAPQPCLLGVGRGDVG